MKYIIDVENSYLEVESCYTKGTPRENLLIVPIHKMKGKLLLKYDVEFSTLYQLMLSRRSRNQFSHRKQ
ncbi:hypothetical protein AQUCO_08000011v1 [Aquilegia coerulea]|uniref:Uncharacterized protein n=1 Tax=Aquilegia coerulea TaxID=218851 RepID=A0A2G5C7R4_AQUCA|nr:hypothetical protein AQUCO_08000011v1 [Aquilegia coerulea]